MILAEHLFGELIAELSRSLAAGEGVSVFGEMLEFGELLRAWRARVDGERDPGSVSLDLEVRDLQLRDSEIDAILRADPDRPKTWPDHDDSRALGEALVGALMAVDRLRELSPFVRSPGDPAWLHAARELSAAELAALREAGEDPRKSWHDRGFLRARLCAIESCDPRIVEFEVRPLFRGSAGRWRTADEIVFEPGTRFAVLDIDVRGGRTRIRLAERSRAGAAWARVGLPEPALDGPLYHYTLGQALPSIVDDGEIGVATPLPGSRVPVAWLSSCLEWERSAVKSTTDQDGTRRELELDELALVGRGLFRIRIDPAVGVLSWPDFAARVGLDRELVERLDRSGREHGADPGQWFCCPWSIPRARWESIEMHRPELGWIPLEL